MSDDFRRAMHEALASTPKSISPKWLYDAAGSDLFEQITRLEEYYPTRQEAALLHTVIPQWRDLLGNDLALVELGSGGSEKTRIVLDELSEIKTYVPIDISPSALDAAAEMLAHDYPKLMIAPVLGDFENLPQLPYPAHSHPIGFFPGSTIGNLDGHAAEKLLRDMRGRLGEGSWFILGADLIKDAKALEAAYDDREGVTAAFNLNLLRRAESELGAVLNIDDFQHRAIWNASERQVEMHLQALRDTAITIDGTRYPFKAGETLHTESSRKYDEQALRRLADASGWTVERFETSPVPSVSLSLWRAA